MGRVVRKARNLAIRVRRGASRVASGTQFGWGAVGTSAAAQSKETV